MCRLSNLAIWALSVKEPGPDEGMAMSSDTSPQPSSGQAQRRNEGGTGSSSSSGVPHVVTDAEAAQLSLFAAHSFLTASCLPSGDCCLLLPGGVEEKEGRGLESRNLSSLLLCWQWEMPAGLR